MKKRLIAALLAISMLVPSGSALAVRLPEQRTEWIYSTSTYINPLYRNEMTAAAAENNAGGRCIGGFDPVCDLGNRTV